MSRRPPSKAHQPRRYNHKWSRGELQRAKAMHKDGMTMREIAVVLERTRKSVVEKLKPTAIALLISDRVDYAAMRDASAELRDRILATAHMQRRLREAQRLSGQSAGRQPSR